MQERSPFGESCCLNCFSDDMEDLLKSQLPVTERNVSALFPDLTDIQPLKCGGMSVIYQAKCVETEAPVALKVVSSDLDQQLGRDRLVEEINALMSLNHPNILKINHGGVTQGGDGFLITELVTGQTLAGAKRANKLSELTITQIGIDLCAALGYVHAQGMVHADVTPGNVMLTPAGEILLLDFGVGYEMSGAKKRSAMGTPYYLAPEQRGGLVLDHRVDVYGVGVLLYEMLVGQVPSPALFVRPSRCDVDAGWDEILKRALQESPENRYQSMGCFCEAIKSMATSSASLGLDRLRENCA